MIKNDETMYLKFRQTATELPTALAIDFLGVKTLYRELLAEIDAIAGFINEKGLKSGDVVTIALPNMPTSAAVFYALNKLGIIANIVHPMVPCSQLLGYMKSTGSKFVFALSTAFAKYANEFVSKQDITVVVCSPSYCLGTVKGKLYDMINHKITKTIVYGKNVLRFADVMKKAKKITSSISPTHLDSQTPSIYLHSGGTTGVPKTIMLSDSAMNNLAMRGKRILGIDNAAGKGMLAVLPIFHGFGLCMCLHTMFVNGCVSVMLPQFSVKDTCKAIARGRVQMMAGVPTMYEKLLSAKQFKSKKLSKLEFAFCGGDTMPQILKQRFDKLVESVGGQCKMFEGYGLTETVTVCSVNTYENNRVGSMGKPLDGMCIKAIDMNTQEEQLIGECGELVVRCDTMMLGYLNDDAATASAIVDMPDGNKWVKTGDFGYVDADGYVFFKQRLKRIIKVNGVAVFPSEIEKYASKVIGVARCAAIGVAHATAGHTVKLFIEKSSENISDEELKNSLTVHLKKYVISLAVPRQIIIVEKLPLTMIGKVDVRKLEEENN